LQLNYNLFINSAFLRQGQLYEFLTKFSKERKKVLVIILGLQEYKTVRKQAMKRIRELIIYNNTLEFY